MSVCIHGALRRQCEACDLGDRLEAVERAVRAIADECIAQAEWMDEDHATPHFVEWWAHDYRDLAARLKLALQSVGRKAVVK